MYALYWSKYCLLSIYLIKEAFKVFPPNQWRIVCQNTILFYLNILYPIGKMIIIIFSYKVWTAIYSWRGLDGVYHCKCNAISHFLRHVELIGGKRCQKKYIVKICREFKLLVKTNNKDLKQVSKTTQQHFVIWGVQEIIHIGPRTTIQMSWTSHLNSKLRHFVYARLHLIFVTIIAPSSESLIHFAPPPVQLFHLYTLVFALPLSNAQTGHTAWLSWSRRI